MNEIWKWAKSVGFNVAIKREKCVEDKDHSKKKRFNQKEDKIFANTEHDINAEVWTKSYLKSIGSAGVIHSICTCKHAKFITCNIRNMNICKELHEDYFNDSTVYTNLEKKQFSVPCH